MTIDSANRIHISVRSDTTSSAFEHAYHNSCDRPISRAPTVGAFNALASYRFANNRSAVIPMSESAFKRTALSDAQVSDRDAFLEDKIQVSIYSPI